MNRRPPRRRGLRRALTVGLAAGVSLGVAATAHAAFPGGNGKIAYVKNLDGNFEIFTVNPDGTGETNISNNANSDNSPDWSPDGAKVAFARSGVGGGLFTMNADGSGQALVPNTGGVIAATIISNVSWSPDGGRIAFGGGGRINVIDADGTGLTPVGPTGAQVSQPEWSPDGTRIAFVVAEDPTDLNGTDVWVMNADGTGATNLTSSPGVRDVAPDWAPDGSRIIYASGAFGAELWAMDPDGSDQTPLSSATHYGPAFAPDGTRIVSGDGSSVFTRNALGADLQTVLAANSRQHDWQPTERVDPPALEDLVVSKTATPSYSRTRLWDIDKSASTKTGWDQKDGSVAVDYTVRVGTWLGAPFGFAVDGVITVTNPNDVEVSLTGMTDSLPGARCRLLGELDEVAPGGTFTMPYTCSLAAKPHRPTVNTVSVSWSVDGRPLPDLGATARVDFGKAEVHEAGPPAVRVTDTMSGDKTRVLAERLSAPRTFHYTRYLRASDTCRTYENTARLVADGIRPLGVSEPPPVRVIEADGSSVRICPPPKGEDPKGAPPVVIVDNDDGRKPAHGTTTPVDSPSGPVIADPKAGPGALTVVKRAAVGRASLGDVVIWAITVKNTGKADLDDVVVRDLLPRHLRLVRHAKAPLDRGARRGRGAVEIPVGDLLIGQRVTIRVATRVVGRPALTPTVVAEAARLTSRAARATHIHRARRGVACNVATAWAGNARSRTAVACIRITRPVTDNRPVSAR